jgi:hypothetical protein
LRLLIHGTRNSLVEVAAPLALDELRLALESVESSLQRVFGDRLLGANLLDETLCRQHVPRPGGRDHLAEERDGRVLEIGWEGLDLLAEVVLEEALNVFPGELRLGVVGLPEPQADDLHLGEADVARPEALRKSLAQSRGKLGSELALEVTRVGVERAPDDPRQLFGGWSP